MQPSTPIDDLRRLAGVLTPEVRLRIIALLIATELEASNGCGDGEVGPGITLDELLALIREDIREVQAGADT